MEVGKLTVQLRQHRGKGVARRLRAKGLVPGVCYGNDVADALPIQLSPKELKSALDPVKRQNTVIELTVEDPQGGARTLTAMLKEYQVHAIKRHILHVDLISIDRDKPVEANIPIKFVGKAAGLVEGGQLNVIRHTVLVRCKPADIPARIELDVSALDIGDVMHVGDLRFPEGVVSLDAERFAIITCVAPAAEEEKPAEAVPAEGEAAAAPAEGEEKKEGAAEDEGEEKGKGKGKADKGK
jgi:large subunit ribosomal protein L25